MADPCLVLSCKRNLQGLLMHQTRQLPDQCFDKPRYTCTEHPPLWIHSYVLGTRLEGKSVYESNVSGGHIIRALVSTMVNFANNKLVTC